MNITSDWGQFRGLSFSVRLRETEHQLNGRFADQHSAPPQTGGYKTPHRSPGELSQRVQHLSVYTRYLFSPAPAVTSAVEQADSGALWYTNLSETREDSNIQDVLIKQTCGVWYVGYKNSGFVVTVLDGKFAPKVLSFFKVACQGRVRRTLCSICRFPSVLQVLFWINAVSRCLPLISQIRHRQWYF